MSFRWKRRTSLKKSKNASNAGELTGPEGDHFTDFTSAIDIFLKYLHTEIIDNILYQSNLYITQKSSRAKPIDRREFIGFLGKSTLMGYHKLMSLTHFLSNEPDLSVPFYSIYLNFSLQKYPDIVLQKSCRTFMWLIT